MVAERVHPHFARNLAALNGGEGRRVAFLPEIEDIEAIIDVAFWASLRREESFTPRISLAFVSPEQLEAPLVFERAVPFASTPLTRIGPAVERPGIHLCVWRQNPADLCVWGATRGLPESCFVLEVVSPGLLLIKRSRGEDSTKFVNIAVLQGDEIKIIDRTVTAAPDRPELLSSLLGFQPEADSSGSIDVLIQLSVSMREHGRGGSLLVVPSRAGGLWKESILQPITYALSPSFRGLMELMEEDPGERLRPRWQDRLRRVIGGVAGLTAVDGATIITDRYELLAFGAKIVRRAGCAQVGALLVSEPIEGITALVAEPGELGGTRHLSAAQFAHDQRDAIALVASQDGRFTVFGWSSCDEMVYANRIEALLF
jgi:hypothetical protein